MLSSFATMVSFYPPLGIWPNAARFNIEIRHCHSRQATLHTDIVYRDAGLIPASRYVSIHRNRVSTI